jgi:flagellar hook-associated protein 1 FlgK
MLEQRIQQQTQASSGSSSRLAALASLEALFTPASGSSTTGTGDLCSAISGFFNSFSQLESNPADPSLRQQVLSTAQTLAGEFNGLSSSLSAQQAALDQQAANSTSAVNGLLTAVATLNQRIAGLAPGADAGTLEDQRQQDLASLSSLIGFDTIRTENNGLTLTTAGGTALVSGGQAVSLSTGLVGGETHFFAGGTDITDDLRGAGGAVGGLLTVRDQDIPQAIGSRDVLAYGIASGVNSANNAGSDLAGDVSGAGDIFAIPGTAAGSAAAIARRTISVSAASRSAPPAGCGNKRPCMSIASG